MAVYCQECGFHQSEAHKFCGRCGAPLGLEGEGTDEHTSPFALGEADDEEREWDGPTIEGPTLAVRAGGPAGQIFSLDAESITVGRSPDSDIFLDDVTVSRDHALIRRLREDVVLRDLGSMNGTYVNRHRIEGEQPLEQGDEVQIGKFRLTYLTGR